MLILVVNCGSSSIKFQAIDAAAERRLAAGQVERIGRDDARLVVGTDGDDRDRTLAVADHREALALVFRALESGGVLRAGGGVDGIAHRVVHGGDRFHEAVRIDERVIAAIRDLSRLAPLHNPANLLGVEVARQLAPDVPQIAVFDTAFHQQLPAHAYTYALPLDLARRLHVRRYGFHGSSHAYVAGEAARWLGRPLEGLRLITLHLGNGCSAAAVRGGRSVDTSMGLTPMEGLVMGTRCGDLDPAILPYLAQAEGLDAAGLDRLLNRDSGLLGLCGDSDMRQVLARDAAGDAAARLAVEVFCYRVRKYIGAYVAVLGGLDALVFTAGIGERSPEIRRRCCQDLACLGIAVDPARNAAADGAVREVSPAGTAVRVLVVPTDEELHIARAARAVIAQGSRPAVSAAGEACAPGAGCPAPG